MRPPCSYQKLCVIVGVFFDHAHVVLPLVAPSWRACTARFHTRDMTEQPAAATEEPIHSRTDSPEPDSVTYQVGAPVAALPELPSTEAAAALAAVGLAACGIPGADAAVGPIDCVVVAAVVRVDAVGAGGTVDALRQRLGGRLGVVGGVSSWTARKRARGRRGGGRAWMRGQTVFRANRS